VGNPRPGHLRLWRFRSARRQCDVQARQALRGRKQSVNGVRAVKAAKPLRQTGAAVGQLLDQFISEGTAAAFTKRSIKTSPTRRPQAGRFP